MLDTGSGTVQHQLLGPGSSHCGTKCRAVTRQRNGAAAGPWSQAEGYSWQPVLNMTSMNLYAKCQELDCKAFLGDRHRFLEGIWGSQSSSIFAWDFPINQPAIGVPPLGMDSERTPTRRATRKARKCREKEAADRPLTPPPEANVMATLWSTNIIIENGHRNS